MNTKAPARLCVCMSVCVCVCVCVCVRVCVCAMYQLSQLKRPIYIISEFLLLTLFFFIQYIVARM